MVRGRFGALPRGTVSQVRLGIGAPVGLGIGLGARRASNRAPAGLGIRKLG